MKLTYSVRASIRNDKKKVDGSCPIYFFVRVGPHVTKIPTGKSIQTKDWDDNKQCPKVSTKIGSLLNMFLTNKINGFNEFTLKQEAMGRNITTTIATSFFKETHEINFFKFWEEQVDLWSHIKEPNTLKSYRSALNIVKEFNPKLNFGDLTPKLIEQFDQYLTVKRGNSIGGRFTKHKCFKSIMNQAIMKGHMQENAYRFFKIKSVEGHRKFLTIDEVKTIMSFDLQKEHLLKIRDMFLFSCFTGLRFSDLIRLKIGDVKTDKEMPRLEINVKKTDRLLMIPLNQNALKLISSYVNIDSTHKEKLIFPSISNAAMNRELKDLIKLVGIEKTISFHCSRHTFACNHVEMKTSILHLKEMMGHKDLRHTQIYAKCLEVDLFSSIKALDLRYQEN
jgi:integrase/recombinase XerD